MNKYRIGKKDALSLFKNDNIIELGKIADGIRKKKHPDDIVTFIIDRNINYTNVCISECKFCAFYKKYGVCDDDAYVLTKEQIFDKIRETKELSGTQILLQGGLNPDITIDYYINLLNDIKENFDIHIHAFSPPEITFIARSNDMTIRETVNLLKEAGLNSVPGGGAEILVDRVRKKISPNKIDSGQWLKVMEEVHNAGLNSSATMMFGTIETDEDIVEHLLKLRDLQDKTGGFKAFIPWSFQSKNTSLNPRGVFGHYYLKVLAVSRIVLDNFDNIQASWVTQGAKMGQVALSFGANDMGSTMLEENVVKAAGTANRTVDEKLMVRLIKDAGFIPAQRTNNYTLIKKYR
ncbi:MAG: dehypoxanthine futalosine cyclase [Deltaproteobacteria bacterium]|jgi:cyclic dehypoxanthinyl futalosine synthase|uniref:Cyclic dehypoxanthine futalosine synthase n=1 Tax=Candidatus Acidulodesulfobacterium acidiphilum TaxID=2597224 RepID=A0A520XDM3_9DELT|nr:dehypoxanthine futalosine cyclase [Deltaproteobacteria bacterium]RZV39313.1 MAG: dehypoxanthine futalosine cyclase [Candidatus Acidulodesulfobacterium acidiphilum]